MVTCSNWACCFSAFFRGVASPPLPFKPNVCHCGCGLRGLCCFFLRLPAKETIQRRWSSFLHAKKGKFSLRWPATNEFGRVSSHHVRHPPCPHDVAALGSEGTAAHHQVARGRRSRAPAPFSPACRVSGCWLPRRVIRGTLRYDFWW